MKRWTSLIVAGLLVVGGAACVAPVSAAGPEADGLWQQLVTRVAGILGIPVQRLTDAVKQASQELVDEAAKAGRLSQEHAHRLKERIAQGQIPFGHGFGPRGPGRAEGRPGVGPAGSLTAAANLLGITPAQLMEELRGGKTLARVAEAHGKTRAQLKDALLAQVKEMIEKAVSNGRLTREQAGARLRAAEGGIDAQLDRSLPDRRPQGDRRDLGPRGPRPPAPAPGT